MTLEDFLLTRREFKSIIDRWHSVLLSRNVSHPNGKPLPVGFFKVMLGIKRRSFEELYSGKMHVWVTTKESGVRHKEVVDAFDSFIPLYLAMCVFYINKMPEGDFVSIAKSLIPVFESSKRN